MRRNPLLLGDRIKHVLNRDAVVVTHVLIVGVVLVDTILSGSASANQKNWRFTRSS